MTNDDDRRTQPAEVLAAAPDAFRLRDGLEWSLAAALLVLPLASWVDVPGSGPTTGYALPTALREFDRLMAAVGGYTSPAWNPFWLMYLLPVFSVAVLFDGVRRADASAMVALAGTVPIASLSYAFGIAGRDVVPMLRPLAFVSLGCAALCVALGAGVSGGAAHPRSARNRAAAAFFVTAVVISALVGYVNRP